MGPRAGKIPNGPESPVGEVSGTLPVSSAPTLGCGSARMGAVGPFARREKTYGLIHTPRRQPSCALSYQKSGRPNQFEGFMPTIPPAVERTNAHGESL